MKKSLSITEIWLLHKLQQLEKANIHQVMDFIGNEKDWTQNTLQTLLVRLCNKGAAARKKEHGLWVYRPLESSDQTVKKAMKELFGISLKKNPLPLLAYLFDGKKIPVKEQEKIKKLFVK